MAKEKKEKHFVQNPVYPGGPQALKAFITQNLRYPASALKEQVAGTVIVKYTINHKGKVIETKIISGLHKDCDEEAERLVKMLTFRVPKQKRPGKILFHKKIKIHFKPPAAPSSATISYEVVPSKDNNKQDPPKEDSGGGYSYTISY